MHPVIVKVFVGIMVIAILAVAGIPMLILVDLTGGGDGWGLCPDGLSACRANLFSGPRLAVVLVIAVIGLMAVLRFFVYAASLLRRPTDHSL